MADSSSSAPTPSAIQDQAFRRGGRHALVIGEASGVGEATVKQLVRAVLPTR